MKQNRILYGVILTLLFIFMLFNGTYIPYTLFFALLIIPIFSFLLLLFAYSAVRTNLIIDKRLLLKGEKVNFTLELSNEKFCIVPMIRITFSCYNGVFGYKKTYLPLTLTMNSKTSFSLPAEMIYCGYYTLKVDDLELIDFLGLFKLHFKDSETRNVLVYPGTMALEKLMIETTDVAEFISMLNTLNDDVSSFSDVREYRIGDHLNRVHWIHTARTGKMMVKNYDNVSKTSLTAIIDLQNSVYDDIRDVIVKDALMCGVASFLDYCNKNEIPVNAACHDGDNIIQRHLDKQQPEEYFNFLTNMRFGERITPFEILKNIENMYDSVIVIFTFNFNMQMVDFFKRESVGGNIIILYAKTEEEDDDIKATRKFLVEKGIKILEIMIKE